MEARKTNERAAHTIEKTKAEILGENPEVVLAAQIYRSIFEIWVASSRDANAMSIIKNKWMKTKAKAWTVHRIPSAELQYFSSFSRY